jgi:hypothetical protein
MWTRAAHGVNPKKPAAAADDASDLLAGGTRYTLITGYRNPKAHEVSKWITPGFLEKTTPGLTRGQKDFEVLDACGDPLPGSRGKSKWQP